MIGNDINLTSEYLLHFEIFQWQYDDFVFHENKKFFP